MSLSAEDLLDLQDLHARYAWALDTGDAQGVADLFAPDAVMMGTNGAVHNGRSAIAAYCRSVVENPVYKGSQHHVGHPMIQGDATKAAGRLYWNVLRADQKTGDTKVHMLGYYQDEYVKQGDRWFFTKREIHPWREGEIPWVGPKVALPGQA